MALAARPGTGDGEDGAEVRRIGPALTFERPPGDPARREGSQSYQRGLAAGSRKRRPEEPGAPAISPAAGAQRTASFLSELQDGDRSGDRQDQRPVPLRQLF